MRVSQHNVFPQASPFPVISKFKNFGTALASLIHLMHSGVSYSFSWPVLAFIVLSGIPGDLIQNPLSPRDLQIHAPIPWTPEVKNVCFQLTLNSL